MGTKVRELAHARAGDKGNTSNIGVFAFDSECYRILEEKLTEDRIQSELESIADGPVTRYEVPSIDGFNFVIENALAGGVTTSLRLDSHGKSLSYAVLDIELDLSNEDIDRK